MAILSVALAGTAAARQSASQEDSLAAAARRAREQKKDQPKPVRVWDNDNIPKKADEITVLNSHQTAAATADSAAASDGNKQVPPAVQDSSAEKKAKLEADLAAAKEDLQTLQNDLDILKRKFVLDQQTYYSKPNYTTDKDGAAALSDEQSQIDAKQLDMGAAQQKITDLQAQLNVLAEQKQPK
jgi:hypothetical protein